MSVERGYREGCQTNVACKHNERAKGSWKVVNSVRQVALRIAAPTCEWSPDAHAVCVYSHSPSPSHDKSIIAMTMLIAWMPASWFYLSFRSLAHETPHSAVFPKSLTTY